MIPEETKKALAKDLEDIQKKHKVAIYASLNIAPLKEEEESSE